VEQQSTSIPQQLTNETPKQRLHRMSRIAGVVLVLVAALCGVVAATIMSQLSDHARRINIAGRQRALSEKIVKHITLAHIDLAHKDPDADQHVLTAMNSFMVLQKSHISILKGDSSLHITGLSEKWWSRHTSAIDSEIVKLEPLLSDFVTQIQTHKALLESAIATQNIDQSLLDAQLHILAEKQEAFFAKMNHLVFLMDEDLSSSVRENMIIIGCLVVLMVGSIFGVAGLILRPTIEYIDTLFQQAQEQTLQLQEQSVMLRERADRMEEQAIEIQHFSEEVMRTNDVLAAQNQELEIANNEKNGVLSIVAHDLRSPLTGISMGANIIRDYAKNLSIEKTTTIANGMIESATRMNEIIDMLLDSQELTNGSMLTHPEDIMLEPFIKSIIQEQLPSAERKHIEINMVFDANIPLLHADPRFVTSIIGNFLSNAIKYSPSATNVWVTVDVNNGMIVCKVRDEGPGVTEDDHKKLFKKFQRLSAQPTAGEKSIGLGLSIVKQMAEQLGTHVSCESSPGMGATFIWTIPSHSRMIRRY
jgi:signal transduction histidine kinase